MSRIFTLFTMVFLSVLTSNSFGQCGPVLETFNANNPGFSGTVPAGGGSFGWTGSALRYSAVNATNGTYTLTTSMFQLSAIATTIDFGYTITTGAQASISALTVTVRYVNTSNQTVTTTPKNLSITAASNSTTTLCTSVPKPSDMITTGTYANGYQLIFAFTATGRGQGAATITIDNYRTSSTNSNASPLPVHFSNFDAKASEGGVALTWKVGVEENVSTYEVEKSNNGRDFSTIGNVAAAGKSSYSYNDRTPVVAAFYRIKSVDVDGKFAYSTVASFKGGKSSIVLKAFPMPVQKDLTVQHGTANSNSRINISAEDGRIIKTLIPSVGSQQTVVDFSTLRAGLYLIRFDNGDGESGTLKVIKQ